MVFDICEFNIYNIRDSIRMINLIVNIINIMNSLYKVYKLYNIIHYIYIIYRYTMDNYDRKRLFLQKINSDKSGFFLFICFYAFSIFLLSIVNSISYDHDNDVTSSLPFHKFIFYISGILSVFSHFQTFLTDPGIIRHENNPHLIEFYLNVRSYCHDNALIFTEKIGKKILKDLPDNLTSDNEDTDDDDYQYPAISSINDSTIPKLVSDHRINFKRCFRCYVVRFPGVRHCSRCQACVVNMDHHCPWVFNCIGQFNQKYYIQFILYTYIALLEIIILQVYYLYMLNYNM